MSFAEWSRRHGDYDVSRSRVVRGWLRFVWALSAPLHRVSPDAVSAAGMLAALAAVATPNRTGAALVVATGVCDGVDGAVAVRRGGGSSHGAVVDTAADRITDALFLLALGRAGARRPVLLAAGAGVAALEAQRAAARRRHEPVTIVTPGERPFRVGYVALGLATGPTAGGLAVAATTLAGAVALYRDRRDR